MNGTVADASGASRRFAALALAGDALCALGMRAEMNDFAHVVAEAAVSYRQL
jgi:hypothetical protein